MNRAGKTKREPTEAQIAEAMLAHGASFVFTPGQCGTLRVFGLSKLPPALINLFFDCNPSSLSAHLRSIGAGIKKQENVACPR